MKKGIYFFLFVLAIGLTFSSCKKSEEFINPVYECDCGKVNWFGSNHDLLMSEFVRPDETNFLSRRYYITADVSSSGESEPHHLNIIIETDSVHHEFFDLMLSPHISVEVEEVNYNDPTLLVRHYVPVIGNVNINAAILGGSESASFNLSVQESFNGTPAGAILPLSGSLNVLVQ